ncbi:hypothetical protein [Endozoicomonas sp. Mp262]|uniref:hypothetical protein n=1 Tax=Endozoicomonas sp. Mp262 TaxID=2919499 RepID=UPI0021E03AAA
MLPLFLNMFLTGSGNILDSRIPCEESGFLVIVLSEWSLCNLFKEGAVNTSRTSLAVIGFPFLGVKVESGFFIISRVSFNLFVSAFDTFLDPEAVTNSPDFDSPTCVPSSCCSIWLAIFCIWLLDMLNPIFSHPCIIVKIIFVKSGYLIIDYRGSLVFIFCVIFLTACF